MIVLGLNCGFSRPEDEFIPNLPHWFGHDAAAVLMVDGEVMAAVEEERLNRLKHTNKFPTQAVTECLAQGNLRLSQVTLLDITKRNGGDAAVGLVIDTATGANSKNVNAVIQDSADNSSWANVTGVAAPFLVAAGNSANVIGANRTTQLPTNTRRYLCAQATGEANGGNSADGNLTIETLF